MREIEAATPAALYARVSSERQDVDLSVSAQLRALRDYAGKHNYVVVREYVDEAESGRIANRPQFRRMLDAARADDAPFSEILVWKFSRFTRRREHAVAFKSMLRRRGIRVTSITEHADDSPTGKLMEAIIESVDEFYSENLGQEVTRGMREAASRGFWVPTYAPYGYRKEYVQDGARKRPRLVLNPSADAVVRRLFRMAASGVSLLDITRSLNDEGIATPNGKRWLKTSIHRLLTNEVYTGTVVWGDECQGRRTPRTRGGRTSRHCHKGGIRARRGDPALEGAFTGAPAPRRQPLSSQWARQVQDLPHAPQRPRGQGRQVHLLRLPVAPEAWTGSV